MAIIKTEIRIFVNGKQASNISEFRADDDSENSRLGDDLRELASKVQANRIVDRIELAVYKQSGNGA